MLATRLLQNLALCCFAVTALAAVDAAAQPRALTTTDRELLAPTGTLRAAFIGTNPVQGRVDPQTGEITGPAADLVRELARQLAVPYQITAAPDVRGVIGHLKNRTADIGFLAYEESRLPDIEYAGPYSRVLNSYVVGSGSPLQHAGEADRRGHTIGAVEGVSQHAFLSTNLKQAALRVFDKQPTSTELEQLLNGGQLTAFGMNRQRALEMQRASSRLDVLPGSFMDTLQEIAVRRGDTPKIAPLSAFIDAMRASGFVANSLRNAGLDDSTETAPAISR